MPAEGELRIEIKGELAGILDLCNAGANQKPGGLSAAGLAQQIKMVAGVSFFATRRPFPSLPAIVQKRFVAQR